MGQRGGEGPAGTRLGPESAHAVAGLGAGVLASVLVAPLDLLKTRLQVQRRGHAKYSRGIPRARPTAALCPPPSPQLSPSATPATLRPDPKRRWPMQHPDKRGEKKPGRGCPGVVRRLQVRCGSLRGRKASEGSTRVSARLLLFFLRTGRFTSRPMTGSAVPWATTRGGLPVGLRRQCHLE